MKRASVESEVLSLPDEAYSEKGYYDSGEAALGDEENILDFEYYKVEDRTPEDQEIGKENLKKIRAFLGKSAIDLSDVA